MFSRGNQANEPYFVVEDEDLIREMLVLALKAEVMRSQPLLMGGSVTQSAEPTWEVSL